MKALEEKKALEQSDVITLCAKILYDSQNTESEYGKKYSDMDFREKAHFLNDWIERNLE